MGALTNLETSEDELLESLPHEVVDAATSPPTALASPTESPQDIRRLIEEPLSPDEDAPLAVSNFTNLVNELVTRMDGSGLLLPDAQGLAEWILAGVLAGHIVLQGPPGTGKTTIARLVADTFESSSELRTATADWSTFDVIGGLVPATDEEGHEVLRPWLGHVTRASERCTRAVRDWMAGHAGPQAHWLIIDEFSRAEMDKAVGALYSALGNTYERTINLWFMPNSESQITLPKRFRIVGTMNDVDASFAYGFSKGLGRRFEFIEVGVPGPGQASEELAAAQASAARWACAEYPALVGDTTAHLEKVLSGDSAYQTEAEKLVGFFALLRSPSVAFPMGTAQMIDVLKGVLVTSQRDTRAFDHSVSGRLVSQLSSVGRSDQEVVLDELARRDWHQASAAAERMFGSQRSL